MKKEAKKSSRDKANIEWATAADPRSLIMGPIESAYIVINGNLNPISHRF